MKIAIVTPGGFGRNGTEQVIPVLLSLVERLASRHDVHVFTLHQYPLPERYDLAGASIHNIGDAGGKLPGPMLMARTIGAIMREGMRKRFDVVHGLWAGQSGLTACLAGRLIGAATVVTVAGGELVSLPEIGYGGSLRWNGRAQVDLSLRLAGAVTSAAQFTRVPLLSRRPNARLIVLGTDTTLFSPPEVEPNGPAWRLLHVASLNRVKDQTTLLKAFREIRASDPDVHLDIVGEDTLGGEIQRLAVTLGVDDAVTFHGFQPSRVVAEMLKRTHLLLHSSVFEDAGPLVFLEAAACGVPTVGTSVGLIDDLSSARNCSDHGHAVCSAAVPVGDYKALAQVTLALLHDDASRHALGRRALDFARQNSADSTADQFERLYQELSERPSRSSLRLLRRSTGS